MAGIGFSLKKLFNKKGVGALCRAYGYAGLITTGPMLISLVLLVSVSYIAKLSGVLKTDRELLNSMITYSLLVTLFITACFNMPVTRFLADELFENKKDKILPSFVGVSLIETAICLVGYSIFLIFSGISFIQMFLCLFLSTVLIVVWTEMLYITALKDFKMLSMSYIISFAIGILLMLLLSLFNIVTIERLMVCVIIAYGILMSWQIKQIHDYFPQNTNEYFAFWSWVKKHKIMIWMNAMLFFGMYGHIIIMYFGPLRKQVKGLFYGAPEYDVAALMAFFSLLVTTVNFVVSVEVNFYPKYRTYYGLFNNNGNIKEIKTAEEQMLKTLKAELFYLGCRQLFVTALFVVIGPFFIRNYIPGTTDLTLSIFKYLCVGYGLFAVANSILLIELYFEDYIDALKGSIIFASVSVIINICQVIIGKTQYLGVGFCAGALCFYFYTVCKYSGYVIKLPYYLLSKQNLYN